jgi:hypothetical protein
MSYIKNQYKAILDEELAMGRAGVVKKAAVLDMDFLGKNSNVR